MCIFEFAPRLRIIGLYSYLDDAGERHSVRYAAGANTGYEVSNAVPDTPSIVRYSAPLYKTNRNARGRVAYERGPGGQYKFIASGPDQRRSESTDADGITRGSYSYLDDKGIQRTVQYIAGAGIGYRVVQSTTGIGTHLAPRPAIPEFGIIAPQSNDISDDDGTGFKTAESGSLVPDRKTGSSSTGNRGSPTNGFGNNRGNALDRTKDYNNDGFGAASNRGTTTDRFGINSNSANRGGDRKPNMPNRGSSRFDGQSLKPNHLNGKDDEHDPPYVSNEYDELEQDRNNDWTNSGRDSTVLKNVGNWYVGLPPGAAVRAHVQSIDLLPLGGRPPSPGEALRHDEQRALSNL